MKVAECLDIQKVDISVYNKGDVKPVSEAIAVERPLEIRLSQSGLSSIQLAITMRTPGDDEDLAKGFLFSEGIIDSLEDIISYSVVNVDIMNVTLRNSINYQISDVKRRLYVSSSCGVCGQKSLRDLDFDTKRLPWSSKTIITSEIILSLPDIMRLNQRNFNETGGLHAAALFDVSGQLMSLREDVGRHNALDKVIGANIQLDMPQSVILVSGRLSYELVQKAAMFGASILVSIGPPSSLAIETADGEGITLVGFLKQESFNIYTHPHRIKTTKE